MTTEEQAAADKAAADAKAATDKAAADKAAADKKAADAAERAKDPKYIERLERERNEAETEARQAKKDAADAKAKLDAIENAKLAEAGEFKKLADKAQKDLADAKAEFDKELSARDKREVNAEIKAVAAAAGLRNPDDALLFLDMKEVKYENGNLTGVDAAIAKLKEERSYLFKTEGSESTDRRVTRKVAPASNEGKEGKAKDAMKQTDEVAQEMWDSFGKKSKA